MSILASIDYSGTYITGTQTNGNVRISLRDENGNPVNGNNIIIYYDQRIGSGTTTHEQVTISGQSQSIYTGLIQDTSIGFYTQFTVTGQSAAPIPAPPVGSCDLLISNIVVNASEGSIGANDGSLTVNATSSYGPIQYSLDNVTFQISPRFDNLSGGLKTVYVTDANPLGCANNKTVTIPILTNLLVSDPSVTLGSNVSRWNAAFNPINFVYQRRDFVVTAASLYNVGGVTGTTLTINGDMSAIVALVAANVIAGINATPIYIYVNTSAYNGVYSVIAATSSSVTINATFTTTTIGFINSDNLRPYYKIITQIQYVDPATGQAFVVESKNRSNATGQITANISTFLQSLLKAVSNSDYQQVNYRDDNLSASYRIAYAESWDDGSDSGYTSDYVQLASTYYVTYTARQLGQKYGGNMAEFVPFPNLSAKWLTDFSAPAYSLTFPFDLSFIYSEALAGYQLYYKITQLDINQNPLPNQILTSYLLNEDRSYLLNTDGSRLIISATNLGGMPIVEHVGLNRLLIEFDFDDVVYYFKIGIYYDDINNNPVQVLSDQLVRIDKDCDYNSVYLRWIGLSGAWNYYRFIFNQEVTLDVQNSTIIQKYVTDWESQESIEEVISKSAGQKMQVHGEDLSVADIKGLQSIKYSPKVQMLVSNSPIKWQTIVVNTATFAEHETNLPVYQFAITFNLPSINIQTQ
jgi:hypothetical protein